MSVSSTSTDIPATKEEVPHNDIDHDVANVESVATGQEDGASTSHYNCVVLGTGMTESILAAAFARRGKSVLHVDQNGFYGRDSSSFNLVGLFDFNGENYVIRGDSSEMHDASGNTSGNNTYQKHEISSSPIRSEFVVIDQYDPISSIDSKKSPSSSSASPPSPSNSTENSATDSATSPLASGDAAQSCAISNEGTNNEFAKDGDNSSFDILKHSTVESGGASGAHSLAAWYDYSQEIPMDILNKMRSNKYRFLVDFPKTALVFSSGLAVDCIRKSGVGEHYLEFQSVEGIYYCGPVDGSMAILPVPCSRADVFQSSLLSMLEKRTLMKFIQAVHDWGKSFEDGFDLHNLNEVELAQGRSLHRPQNKDSLLNKVDFTSQYDKPFISFMESFSLSKKLQNIVVHAICLDIHSQSVDAVSDNSGLTSLAGLKGIYQHLDSLGKIGDGHALLIPVYGSGVFSEAFCRGCAVWGGTYMLRTGLKCIEVPLPSSSTSSSSSPASHPSISSPPDTASCSIHDSFSSTSSASSTSSSSSPSSPKNIQITDDTGKIITCDKFVCNVTDWSSKKDSKRRILTSVSVFNRAILPKSRSILVIPPLSEGIGNEHAVLAVQYDSSTCAMPDGFFYLAFHTEVKVASSYDDSNVEDKQRFHNMCMHVIKSAASVVIKCLGIPSDVVQLTSITCLRPIYVVDCPNLHNNVRISSCQKGFTVSVHEYFEEAKDIFAQFYPDEDFLSCYREVASIYGNADDLEGRNVDDVTNLTGDHGEGGDGDVYVEEIDDETEQDFVSLERALNALKQKSEKSTSATDNSSPNDDKNEIL